MLIQTNTNVLIFINTATCNRLINPLPVSANSKENKNNKTNRYYYTVAQSSGSLEQCKTEQKAAASASSKQYT